MSIIGLLIILSLQGAQLIGADFESTPNEIEMPVRKKIKADGIDSQIKTPPITAKIDEGSKYIVSDNVGRVLGGCFFPEFGDNHSLIEAMNKHYLILIVPKNK